MLTLPVARSAASRAELRSLSKRLTGGATVRGREEDAQDSRASS